MLVYSADELGGKLSALDLCTMKTYNSGTALPFVNYALEVVGSRALIVGGLSFQTRMSVVTTIIWNIREGTFVEGPCMNSSRHQSFLVNYENQLLFVVGGHVADASGTDMLQQKCEVLNLQTMKWSDIPEIAISPILSAFLYKGRIVVFSEEAAGLLDVSNMEAGWKIVLAGNMLLFLPMHKAHQISDKEVLLFGTNGIEYMFNMDSVRGEGRLSAVRVNPQNTIAKAQKFNGFFVFDVFQRLWLYHCVMRKWKLVDMSSMTDEATLLASFDSLSLS